MTFSINNTSAHFNSIILHNCRYDIICNQHSCRATEAVTVIRYLGIIFDNNLKWNLHYHNLVGKLRSLTYTFILLNNLIPKQTIRLVL